ncbi:YbaN family protein [Paludibaculum fermentans]|uniref:YbaN family protein n=1 Tax=Paludibaculum fermentans TaxID=1473598 RepID=A0A7S7NUW2_PALFE|nr:YbaN family protein [Paludibaculum fermentans]QOY90257.1 YbaN family protein [Paludibaculum fermentans]
MKPGDTRRILYTGLGCLAAALAFVGVVVPGLPSTEFVLAAAYCFARSSPRMESWLLRHRWFGPTLRRFRETGGITRTGKLAALGSMWSAVLVSSAILAAVNRKAALASILMACVGTLTLLFVVRTAPDRA